MSAEAEPATLGPALPGMRCLRRLGSGGFADVYLYEREHPRGRVAVKLLKDDGLDDRKRVQFRAEADAMADLSEHPHIVAVQGAGTADDGRPYLVMQYYPQSDLEARVSTDPMSVRDVLRYGIQLSGAVETAHRANIIHRDIKPGNILLTSDDRPGLTDFGIAGRPDDPDANNIALSMPWCPPEVLTGASNGSVTSDVYSLAATVWTLLVGHAPFHIPHGDNSERATFTRIVHSPPPVTGRGDTPASLERLLQQAMAKDAGHRPQTAIELARHFHRIEQELRLGRTEIVVLDPFDHDQPERPTPPTAPGSPVSPVTISAPIERGPNPLFTDPLNVPPRSRVADQATRGRPQRADTAQPAPVRFVPAVTTTPPATGEVRAEVSPRGLADGAANRPTTLRPKIATEPAPSPARPRSGVRPPLLVGGAVILVVLVAGIVLALSSHGGPRRAAAVGTTKAPDGTPSQATPDDSLTPPDPGSVNATVRGHEVVFRWPAVRGVGEYSWVSANGASHTITTTHIRVPRQGPGRVCVTVHSVRPGAPVSPGRHSCGG